MLTLVKNKRKTRIDLHDKRVVEVVAEAIARTRVEGVDAKACRNEARTVVSAYILGQDVETAAQRLLSWWCIDCGMPKMYLDNSSVATVEKVMTTAKVGYAQLEAIDKYGYSHVAPQPKHVTGSAGVPPV